MSGISTVIIGNNSIVPNHSHFKQEKSQALTNRYNDVEKSHSHDLSMLGNTRVHRHFEIYEATGNLMVIVTAKDTGKVIKEIPESEMLELKTRIREMTGLLYHKVM